MCVCVCLLYTMLPNLYVCGVCVQYALYKKMTQAAILIQSKFRSYYEQKRFQQSRREGCEAAEEAVHGRVESRRS